MPVQELRHLSFEKEGVKYTVFVESGDGAMWGTWKCEDCGVGGRSMKHAYTINEAILCAQTDLEAHHEANHPMK